MYQVDNEPESPMLLYKMRKMIIIPCLMAMLIYHRIKSLELYREIMSLKKVKILEKP